ncbi:MAG: FecR family protein [Thermodesulfobacteriota bacterium]
MKLKMPIFAALLALCVWGVTTGAVFPAAAAELLPPDMVVKKQYQPGVGAPVGTIDDVRGEAVIIHPDDRSVAYKAAKAASIYKNDTLVTLEDAHLGFSLQDGSYMTLSPKTRLSINKSVYSPEQKTRSSFLSMALGKARFIVKKLVDARHSEFKVKTETSVAGVRGSDFVIAASAGITEITTLSETVLEVISSDMPDSPPLVLRDFERTRVRQGEAPAAAQKLEAEEIERLLREFTLQPPEIEESGKFETEPRPKAAEDRKTEAEADIGQEPLRFRVAEEQLVPPVPANEVFRRDGDLNPEPSRHIEINETREQIQEVHDIQDEAFEEKSEPELIEETALPEFPGAPVQ